ncbi:MAG: SH3 domain-containing protein [Propionibacterium sp.]|nr:SH3 domain-containing protein [Propionibacterium sp.]
MWATTSVNIRSGPGTGFGVVTAVRAGHELTVTNVVVDDRWQQVRLDGSVGFVSNRYLTDDEPAAPAPTPTRESEPSAQPSEAPEQGVSLEACRAASGIESGLTGRTVDVLRAICNEFPSVSSYGGYRSGGGSYHSQGRAIDVMISGEAGWEVARWVRANASELGVIEVIYAQRIWTTQRAGEGWRPMSDRGSASANHYDHVHVSVR